MYTLHICCSACPGVMGSRDLIYIGHKILGALNRSKVQLGNLDPKYICIKIIANDASRIARLCVPVAVQGSGGGRKADTLAKSEADFVLEPLRSAHHLLKQRDAVSAHAQKADLVDHPKQDELRRLLNGLNTASPVCAWAVRCHYSRCGLALETLCMALFCVEDPACDPSGLQDPSPG